MSEFQHLPVMLNEVVEIINPQNNSIYVDATFGAGGYTKALLAKADCQIIALDRDPEAIAKAVSLQKQYGQKLTVNQAQYSRLAEIITKQKVDGVLFDIGISSMQIDNPERGFSFNKEGPLDMRMSQDGLSAQEIVNTFKETELADLIFQYGEEKASRKIAKAIVSARNNPITTTTELAQIIKKAQSGYQKNYKIDPATRTFQALRIYVNNELEELEKGLAAAETILKTNGKLVVVTFHSLEDRIVKNFLKKRSGTINNNRHLPANPYINPTFFLPNNRPLKPSAAEINHNPRSRSAKLRFAIRTNAINER